MCIWGMHCIVSSFGGACLPFAELWTCRCTGLRVVVFMSILYMGVWGVQLHSFTFWRLSSLHLALDMRTHRFAHCCFYTYMGLTVAERWTCRCTGLRIVVFIRIWGLRLQNIGHADAPVRALLFLCVYGYMGHALHSFTFWRLSSLRRALDMQMHRFARCCFHVYILYGSMGRAVA